MSEEQFELIREWVRMEIEYALASVEEGSDGYRCSAHGERDEAEKLFQSVKANFAGTIRDQFDRESG